MPELESHRNRRWIIIAVALLIAAGALYAFFPGTRDRVTVRSAKVNRTSIVKTVPTNGKVEPLNDYQAHATAPSTIEGIYVHLGDGVHPGQRLLLLDASDAQLHIVNARTQVQVAAQDLRNVEAARHPR